MKLDFASLISPYPLGLQNVGHIKSPTLREIWNPNVTYQGYNTYLSMLLLNPQFYFENINPSKLELYQLLSDEEKSNISVMDLIKDDTQLQEIYCTVFNFFFEENIIWDDHNSTFVTYVNKNEDGDIIPVGIVHESTFYDICDIILQRCGINKNETNVDESKVKSKRALEILKRIKNAKTKTTPKHDTDTELPNIISKVSVMAKSINYINIWDLTVFQLYEQFKQECSNVYFNIQSMSVAAYGDEKKTFKGNEWYKSEN